MKRLTFLAVMLAVLASCTKEVEYARVRLDFTLTDNTMTKVTTAQVQGAVETAVRELPIKIFYSRVGEPMKSCDAGDVVSIPVGDVKVRLEYYGDSQGADDVYFYDVPYVHADTTLAFHSYYSELIVTARFKCAMVVVDPSETESVSIGGNDLNMADYGSFKAFYVFTDVDNATTDIKVYAVGQTDFKTRTLTLDPSHLEWGKWYMLSPTGISESNAEFNYEIDGFDEGGRI